MRKLTNLTFERNPRQLEPDPPSGLIQLSNLPRIPSGFLNCVTILERMVMLISLSFMFGWVRFVSENSESVRKKASKKKET